MYPNFLNLKHINSFFSLSLLEEFFSFDTSFLSEDFLWEWFLLFVILKFYEHLRVFLREVPNPHLLH